MKFEMVLFDLDGTLMDTSKGIIHAVDHIVDKFHLIPLSEAEKRSFIGPPIQDSFRNQYHLSKERAWELATNWRNVYKDVFLLEAEPYDGIYNVLRFCHECGIKTGVATNKREDYARKLLDHYGFIPFFDFIAGTDFAGEPGKADLIRMGMKYAEIEDRKRCLMVGDTIGDLKAATEAGASFLGVTYGFGSFDGAPHIQKCNHVNDICKYIAGCAAEAKR